MEFGSPDSWVRRLPGSQGRSLGGPAPGRLRLPLVAHAEGDGGGLVVALPLDPAVEEGGEVVADGEQVGLALDLAEHPVDVVVVEEVGSAGDDQHGVGAAVPFVPD